MKTTFLVGLIIIFFSFIFSFALAQEATPLTVKPSPTPLEYALPYPGILPDHPLYFLKRLRDTILLRLVSSPLRKVEFYILLSDKRLNMSISLMESGKEELALKTSEEAIGFLRMAEKDIFMIAAGAEPGVNSLKDKLDNSLLKHSEVFGELASKSKDQAKWQDYKKQIETLHEEYLRKK